MPCVVSVCVCYLSLCTPVRVYARTSVHVSERMRWRERERLFEWPLKERKRGGRETELDCTFTDENFMTLNLDRLLVSVRITAAARTFMNY